MYKYDLSVIVPVYNVERYLKEAVDSLLNASLNVNLEIILVDDGSTDNSGIICDQYKKRNHVKIIHKENAGLPSARKAGLRQAEGEYIGFLDGDDYVDTNYYSRMIEAAKKANADLVASQFTYEYSTYSQEVYSNVPSGFYEGSKLVELRDKIIYCEPYYSNGILPSLCMKIIKYDYMDKYLSTVPDYLTLGEDASCSYPIMYSCDSIYVLGDNVGYHYRQHNESMSVKADPGKIKKITDYLNYLNQNMRQHFDKYSYQIYRFYSWQIRDAIRNEIYVEESEKERQKKFAFLRNDEVVKECLLRIQGLPLKYAVIFKLFQYRCYFLLVVFYRLLKK